VYFSEFWVFNRILLPLQQEELSVCLCVFRARRFGGTTGTASHELTRGLGLLLSMRCS
jgi:hypothetical protein